MPAQQPVEFVQLAVWVDSPPSDVLFAVQRGKNGLLPPCLIQSNALLFRFELRLGPALASGLINFLGEFAQGPPNERFVYINSGKRAGQQLTLWDRRAKLKLAGIPASLVAAARAEPARVLETRIHGTMKDGGPVCASIRSDSIEWRLK